jgi:SpoVK/Ycf46/Vps4 family AAA+-type ATPase
MAKKVLSTNARSEMVNSRRKKIKAVSKIDSLNLSTEVKAALGKIIIQPSGKMDGKCILFAGENEDKLAAAAILSKKSGQTLFRIDLSQVTSKFIGETEKNLARIFEQAEQKDWILFFDEADALFGKRTKVKDTHDRFANELISFLLQRIESFNGLTIISSNDKENLNKAILSNCNTTIDFSKAKPRNPFWWKFQDFFKPKIAISISELTV